jgi:hypothetical protein
MGSVKIEVCLEKECEAIAKGSASDRKGICERLKSDSQE